MRIGLVGPGKVGKGLADRWFKRGHEILFSFSRSEEKLRGYAAEYGDLGRWGTPRDAVEFGDVVVLCCNWEQVPEAVEAMGDLAGKALIETVNTFQDDGTIAIGHSSSAAEEIARMSQGALVVPAFNSVPATLLAAPEDLFGDSKAAVFYCGDDLGAKAAASRLIEDAGFEAVGAGPLKSARLIEPFAMLTVQAAINQKVRNIGFSMLRPRASSS